MTWVKLGEERVNTDAIARYYAAKTTGVVVRLTNGEERVYWDDDGALLRALDEACGISENTSRTFACSKCGNSMTVRLPGEWTTKAQWAQERLDAMRPADYAR